MVAADSMSLVMILKSVRWGLLLADLCKSFLASPWTSSCGFLKVRAMSQADLCKSFTWVWNQLWTWYPAALKIKPTNRLLYAQRTWLSVHAASLSLSVTARHPLSFLSINSTICSSYHRHVTYRVQTKAPTCTQVYLNHSALPCSAHYWRGLTLADGHHSPNSRKNQHRASV